GDRAGIPRVAAAPDDPRAGLSRPCPVRGGALRTIRIGALAGAGPWREVVAHAGCSLGSRATPRARRTTVPASDGGLPTRRYPVFFWILAVRDETTDELDRLADGPIHQRPAGAPLSDRARSDRRGDRPADLLGRRGAGHVPRSRPSLADVFDRANDRVVGVLV